MDNILALPSAIYGMSQFPLVAATPTVDTNANAISANVSGSERVITEYADLGGGETQARSVRHGFLTGDTVLITGGPYAGEHVVTRDTYFQFSFTAVYTSTEADNTAREIDAEIVYSPVDGLPAIRCIGLVGNNSTWTWTVPATTIYPTSVIVVKNVGFVDGSGALDTSEANTIQRPPVLVVSEETDAATARANAWQSLQSVASGGYSDQWRVCTPARKGYTEVGTVKPWCSTLANVGFTTTAISIQRPSSGTSTSDVFYLGGVLTENVEKAKIIIGFDSMHEGSYLNAVPGMKSKGWEGQLFPYQDLHDQAAYKARVQDLYDSGWDISNHSKTHTTMDGTQTEQDWIADTLSAKRWAVENGWLRGSEFYAYPGTTLQLDTDNGADIADQYFEMGRGQGYRGVYNSDNHGSITGYEHQYPHDTMNINHQPASAGDNEDYSLSDTKTELASTVLGKGVLNLYLHDVKDSPDAIQVSIEWWDAFFADVSARVDAGELEVITMTEWYDDIHGFERIEASVGGGNRYSGGGRYGG